MNDDFDFGQSNFPRNQFSQPGFGEQTPKLVDEPRGLVASGVGKSFDKRRVVRNVSLKLQRGEAVGLLGPNGAGKTTTFHILAGLLPADEGNVQIDGRDITGLPVFQRARLGIGYLPQESSIFRGLTVEQNIRAVLETLDNSRSDRDAMLEDLMAEFAIGHLRRRKLDNPSEWQMFYGWRRASCPINHRKSYKSEGFSSFLRIL